MRTMRLLAVLGCSLAIAWPWVAHSQKSGRKSAPPPPVRSSPRSSGGKSVLGSISVSNIKFNLKNQSESCPLLIQASDGMKYTGKQDTELCGEAPFSWIGKRFALTNRQQDVAIWRSELQEPYRACRGKTQFILWNGEKLNRDASHVLLDFDGGWVTLTVNLNKRRYNGQLTSATVTASGHPHWCWSQSGDAFAQQKKQIEFLSQ